jgi:hypothetical protein
MVYRIKAARVAMVAAALTVAVGAGPAAAEEAETPAAAVTGWVVENPRPDNLYDTFEGSVTLGLASGETVSCSEADGWGRADSETLPPGGWYAVSGVTAYTGCTGPGAAADLQVFSTPEMVFGAETYDAAADRVTGPAFGWIWGLFLDTPDCQIDLYIEDPDIGVPVTYDNRTKTFDTGTFTLVATRADGAGCAGLVAVGDLVTYETTFVATPGFTVRPV